MSFCLRVEIDVVSFLYFDTMTEYQSEVMLYIIYTPEKNQYSSVLLSNEHILWKVGIYSENSWSFQSFYFILVLFITEYNEDTLMFRFAQNEFCYYRQN